MFTTIELLRASHAMQNRVDTLERAMKKQVPGFTSQDPIRISDVLRSNGTADALWVANNDSVTRMTMKFCNVDVFVRKTKAEAQSLCRIIIDDCKTQTEAAQMMDQKLYGDFIPSPKTEKPAKQAAPAKGKTTVAKTPAQDVMPVTLDVRRTMDKFKKYGKVHVGKITGKQHEERVTIAIYVTVPASHELVGLASS